MKLKYQVLVQIHGFNKPAAGAPLQTVKVWGECESVEAAQAFAAQFPKSVRVHGTRLYLMDGSLVGGVSFEANFRSNKTTGEANEASFKRVRNFVKACDKIGVELVRDMSFLNSIDCDIRSI